mmetsp:Transcript_34512/g.91634  ORF Transcript_34512/g.91634 Transcript_34512/m.91634 type:complete len:327 (+) Transcript_34512:2432-3412(+)
MRAQQIVARYSCETAKTASPWPTAVWMMPRTWPWSAAMASTSPSSPPSTSLQALSRRCSCLRPRSQIARASGSETVSVAFSRAGRRSGRNGAESRGFSTSLDMLSMITAVWRRVVVDFSRRPRTRSGTSTAMAGASMVCTNTTPASLCMSSGTCLGLRMQVTRSLRTPEMSELPATLSAFFMASFEADLTSFLVSVMHGVRPGTMSGRQAAVSAGASSTAMEMRLRALTRLCQWTELSSMRKITGMTNETAGQAAVMRARPVSAALLRTPSSRLEPRRMTASRAWSRYGSAEAPIAVVSAVMASSAPACEFELPSLAIAMMWGITA